MSIDAALDSLLGRIAAFRDRHGLSESAFGRRAVNDDKLLNQLRAGRATLRTLRRVERFMADYRPDAVAPETAEPSGEAAA